MDDLKTFAKDDNQQTRLLEILNSFCNYIGMELRGEKCAKATFKRGKLNTTSNIQFHIRTTLKPHKSPLRINEGYGIRKYSEEICMPDEPPEENEPPSMSVEPNFRNMVQTPATK